MAIEILSASDHALPLRQHANNNNASLIRQLIVNKHSVKIQIELAEWQLGRWGCTDEIQDFTVEKHRWSQHYNAMLYYMLYKTCMGKAQLHVKQVMIVKAATQKAAGRTKNCHKNRSI